MPDDELRHDVRQPPARWLRWLWGVTAALFVVSVVLRLVNGAPARSYIPLVLFVVAGVVVVVSQFRPQEVVVDAQGVRIPLRGLTPWSKVVSVRAPGPFTDSVVLRLDDGTERSTLLPTEHAERVAAIGRVPLE